MRRSVTISVLVLVLAACGGSDDDADGSVTVTDPPAAVASASESDDAAVEATPSTTGDASGATDEPEQVVPGPGDAVGTLTGPDLDIVVVGQCNYDVSDLGSPDIAFADVRGVDPSGVEWPARFGLSGSPDRNTQVNVNGTAVVVRWSEPGLLEQSSDEGSYRLDTTIGRLVVSAGGYELNISCFER